MRFMKDIQNETMTLGGKSIPVAVVKPLQKPAAVPSALASLLKGMRLTGSYFVRPWKIVTKQYPENRATLKFPARYRAMLHLSSDENGYHRCTACRLCEKACPNASIKVTTQKGAVSGKIELDRYIWRLDSCVFCNACVQACPFDALEMGHQFENAVYDRRLLISTLNRYAGPPANILLKQEDPAIRASMMQPRDRCGGPVPLSGVAMPVVKPVVVSDGNGEK